MDMNEYAKILREGKSGQALQELTQSELGAKLAAKWGGADIEKAAREGDAETLSRLLQSVLSTPEGREFAARVQKTVDGHGR